MGTTPTSEVRPATREDGPALRALSVATFPNNAEADLVDALLAGDAWVDGLSQVAEADDGSLALALAPCAVHPDVQRRGVGTATIAAALEAARAAGEALVVVLGHAAYYARFGFVRASTLGIEAPLDVPEDAWMALVLDPERVAPSGTVAYADAFGVGT